MANMRISQKEMILKHLKESSITSFEAFMDYGITRLSSIIHVLRGEGYTIISIPKKHTNRFGGKVTYAEYKLAESQGELF